jgi:hypothetical protein
MTERRAMMVGLVFAACAILTTVLVIRALIVWLT